MATIKSHTDLSQSKLLSNILRHETADMFYVAGKGEPIFIGNKMVACGNDDYDALGVPDVLCWSLAALLNVLPNNEYVSTTTSRGSWKVDPVKYLPNIWWCEYEDTKNQTEFNISADNQVDACYEMILKLHGLNLL